MLCYLACCNICSNHCPAELKSSCSRYLQYKYANYSNANYNKTGKTTLKFRLINQRADFAFALFSGGLSSVSLHVHVSSVSDNLLLQTVFYITCVSNLHILINVRVMQPKLVAISNAIVFANPKAPLYPRLALSKNWDEVSFCVNYDL